MSLLQAVILGIVQGATEFIPVSSSGHLIVVPRLLGWEQDQGLAFDAALHLGTLVAVVSYFRRDLVEIVVGGIRGYIYPKTDGKRVNLLTAIILASIPAAIAGLLLEDTAETVFRSPFLVAGTLCGVGVVMLLADRLSKKTRPMEHMKLLDWLAIGVAQVLALVPGVSRSGITISAGLFRNLERETAARASFLLSIPTIAGAAGLAAGRVIRQGLPMEELAPFAVGIVTAGIVGYICIGFLLLYLKRYGLELFVYYRFGLAAVILTTMLFLR